VPGRENPLRTAVWEFMRPDALPTWQLNRDTFVLDETLQSTVRLDQRRRDSDLAELDLGENDHDPVAA
jgi:hypothetical protein